MVALGDCLVALNRRETKACAHRYFKKWRNDGSWKRIQDRLVGWVRVVEDRDPSPSVTSVDSQTVPTAVMVSESVGYDAGKKTKGLKRFTMVDIPDLSLSPECRIIPEP